MNGKILMLFFLFILGIFQAYSQDDQTHYLVELNTIQATKSTVPFWLSANSFGRIQKQPSTIVYTTIYSDLNSSKNDLKFSYKVGTTAYTGEKSDIFIDELFGDVRYKNLGITIGVKHPEVLWEGLSSTNGTITKSINARSYPGYKLYLKNFISLPFAKKWLSVKGNYGDYLLNDKRSVTNTRLHTKSLFLKSLLNEKCELIVGMNHYAQWAGNSTVFGKQPSSFKDYLRVITGSSGGSDALEGDQINVIGNQLGSYQIQFNYRGSRTNWNLYWSHLFEDRSGRELMNYPDALYGVFIDFKNPKALVSHILTEFTYTKHASGDAPHYTDDQGIAHAASGMDNYFNNGVYQSGWTYFGNTIGSPYFTTKPVDVNVITPGIIDGDNRFMAFNLGLKGVIKNLQYKAMLSHIAYVGWFGSEYLDKPTQTSGIFEVTDMKMFKLPFEIAIGTAFDTGTYRPVNFGGYIKLTKRGTF